MRTLGMIGGTSWVSTIDYYRLINEGINARLGGNQFARCVVYSLNFGDVEQFVIHQNWDGFLEMATDAGTKLKRAGVEGVILCANTAHIVADRLQPRLGLPLIHIVEATAAAIKAQGLTRVTLLGTRVTMEADFFRDGLARHGITALTPPPADREFIHRSVFDELGRNIIRDETRARYLDVIGTLRKQGSEGVILGCTEIPLLIQQKHLDVPAFDTTAIHAAAAVEFMLG
jgi:aspartate racemase